MSFIAQFHHDDARLDLGGRDRVLTLWQCEHDPGMCATWAPQSGANAALVVATADVESVVVAADPAAVVYPEVIVTSWSDEDNGVPPTVRPAFFDETTYLSLGEDWWGRGGFDTRLGGVPSWIQSADEAPGSPWEFIGQIADSQSVDGAVRAGHLQGERVGIQRRVGDQFQLEPPPGISVEQVDHWIAVDETGQYVPGPNFGDGGIAYVFLDRSIDPPAGLLFWQCG